MSSFGDTSRAVRAAGWGGISVWIERGRYWGALLDPRLRRDEESEVGPYERPEEVMADLAMEAAVRFGPREAK